MTDADKNLSELHEIASAYLDGEATSDEAARVADDPQLQALIAEMRAVKDQVAQPVAPPSLAEQDRAIAQALGHQAPVVSLDEARRRRFRVVTTVTAAAAAVLIAVVLSVTIFDQGGNEPDLLVADTASDPAADSDLATESIQESPAPADGREETESATSPAADEAASSSQSTTSEQAAPSEQAADDQAAFDDPPTSSAGEQPSFDEPEITLSDGQPSFDEPATILPNGQSEVSEETLPSDDQSEIDGEVAPSDGESEIPEESLPPGGQSEIPGETEGETTDDGSAAGDPDEDSLDAPATDEPESESSTCPVLDDSDFQLLSRVPIELDGESLEMSIYLGPDELRLVYTELAPGCEERYSEVISSVTELAEIE